MTATELGKRKQRAAQEVLVISETREGYRVYAPTNPRRTYLVSGLPEHLTCTCPDFQNHTEDREWQCKHVLAVRERMLGNGQSDAPAGGDGAERNGGEPQAAAASTPATGQMFLKRSVSPDGRIDALSVGFSWPMDDLAVRTIGTRIDRSLDLQKLVVEKFLGRERKPEEKTQPRPTERAPQERNPEAQVKSPAVPARLLTVGGMDGKWGRRLFLNVQVNGKTLRLFGTEKRLGDALTGAGFVNLVKDIAEGLELNVPCRVTTIPSADGRYENIDQVFPAEETRSASRLRR
jgi:hypothetical protein